MAGKALTGIGILPELTRVADCACCGMSSRLPSQIPPAQRVAEVIEASLEKPPGLKVLAQEVNMTPFQLSRIFRRYHGETIPGYIRRLRMARAASMLAKSNMMIRQVAFAVGYQSLGAFVRGFTRELGRKPSTYRKESRAGGEKSGGLLGLVAAWLHDLSMPLSETLRFCC